MTIYALRIIEILNGLRIFMGWGHGRVKNSYRKIRDPLITFDRKGMERLCNGIKDSPRGALSFELYPPS